MSWYFDVSPVRIDSQIAMFILLTGDHQNHFFLFTLFFSKLQKKFKVLLDVSMQMFVKFIFNGS